MKRSITDTEIGLIKAMVSRKMKNKEIQFFFNRPDRSVNSGRITDIKKGKYSNSAAIGAATDAELDHFIESFKSDKFTASIALPAGVVEPKDEGPCSPANLARMFEDDGEGNWRFQFGESDTHECKEDFGTKHTGKWLRAVAALANHKGGYILFGVKDKKIEDGVVAVDSYRVAGLKTSHFENADPSDFTKLIKSTFDPTPRVESHLLSLGELKVGILFVHSHPSRPVVALKGDGDQVREGDIFFRYPGQSARIKYSDLRAILDERDRQAREQILPMVERLLSAGPKGAMIADLEAGVLTDEKRSITIGEDLLQSIQFIREGEFDEVEGGATLRLVGDVQALDGAGNVVRRRFVTSADLIADFLSGQSPYDPKEYIRCVIQSGGGAWLPLHYYAKEAGLTKSELASYIDNIQAPKAFKKVYIDRVSGITTPYSKVGGDPAKFLQMINTGFLPDPATSKQAVEIAKAIAALEDNGTVHISDLRTMLQQCWEIVREKRPDRLTYVRKAICRVDELFYAA